MKPEKSPASFVGVVCVILAVGISVSLTAVTIALVWESLVRPDSVGLSENATQVLTGWGGGILGVLGAFMGYSIGAKRDNDFGIPPVPKAPKPLDPPDLGGQQ